MYWPILVVFLAAQLTLLGLEVWELGCRREHRTSADPIHGRTLAFLTLVTVLFLGLQLCGSWLSPPPGQILDRTRHCFLPWPRIDVDASESFSSSTATLLAVLLFYVAGLGDYLVHRFFSHSRWFWFTHEYHHLPRQVSILMPGIGLGSW